ncbi:non-ribosomal peptide synthetase [Pseudoalteromonas sp. MMG022]|uniref:non-ribosomal peptide synthetase n=1 Tax=Pseudoalteromonas sp. MMG022 TaxID=2909978 RepID=UPI001F2910E2|nr:non-ribosomal peptide synthetase [Pseudoalteromonas sp. MMG022]MCF6434836.1 amino acid adenylation domain-containing protein [Pseudoalteromonas sp. MMG022]
MQVVHLVKELNQHGIFPYVEHGKLKTKSKSTQISQDLIAKIKHHKDDLISFLSDTRHANATASTNTIVKLEPGQETRLSYSQQRLWFIDQLEQTSSQYNMTRAIYLRGTLNRQALQDALNEVVSRHEVLRTVYFDDGGEPRQRVTPVQPLSIINVDLSALDDAAQASQLQQVMEHEFSKPFDLSSDVMLRLTLVQLANDYCALLFNVHHIASDGWSMGILTREFVELYHAYVNDQPSPLLPLPVQYSDYTHWQRSQVQQQRLQTQLDYWLQQLSDIPTTHGLPLDKPRPAQQEFAGQGYTQFIDQPLYQKLLKVCQQFDVTLFMLLQSSFALLLGRWSSDSKVVMGCPIAGRTQREIEPLIGFFVNTLVFKTDLDENVTFAQLLAQSKNTALEAFTHQETPFDMLVEQLQPKRSMSHSPIFQVMFALQNNDYGELTLPGIEVSGIAGEVKHTRFDLELFAGELGEQFVMQWNFATSIFELKTIQALAQSFTVLLEGIVAAPHTPIFELPITSSADKTTLQQWRAHNQVPYSEFTQGVHHLIAQHVQQSADDIALTDEVIELSYAQLDSYANQFAHALLAQGLQPGDYVGISQKRSAAMIISVLAVLKAGGAYVALDPNYPQERLNYISKDSGIKLLICDDLPRWQALSTQVTVLDVNNEDYQGYPYTQPDVDINGQSAAYVIYTSGSTGQPKGTVLSHQVLENLMRSQFARYENVAQKLPTLQYSTLNFDMAIYEIMTALCSGSKLVIVDEPTRQSLPELLEVIVRQQIGCLYLPTAMLVSFCEYVTDQALHLPSLKVLQVAGEALKIYPQIRAFFGQHRHCQLLNLYGPSETHVVTDYQLKGDAKAWPLYPSIGKPIHNANAYIMDSNLSEVPIGCIGELYISGPCLADKYINRDELTTERFIAHPEDSQQRMYRTGDLVRYVDNGNIAYLGRADEQVKIRGFRVEPQEIEQQLLQTNLLKAAVVTTVELANELHIVAYVTVLDATTDAAMIKAKLKACLPEYLVPSHIQVMDKFALTANGKVDKRALPAPSLGDVIALEYVAANTPSEQLIQRLWCELLDLSEQQVSCAVSFFDLGGHSLLAMRLSNAIRRELDVEVPVRVLFVHETIKAIAKYIDELDTHSSLTMIKPVDRDQSLPLSFSQQRLWFVDQLNGSSTQYNLPLALELKGELDITALQQSFTALVARHEVLRTTFEMHDGEAVQCINEPQAVAIAQHDLSSTPESEQHDAVFAVLHKQIALDFDLAQSLMIRVDLIQLSEQHHVLLVVMHHIASDGWSLGLVADEISTFYQQWRQQGHCAVTPLALQYADYAAWQRQHMSEGVIAAQLDYWQEQLADIPQVHSLPLDKPRPVKPSYCGDSVSIEYDLELSSAIGELAQQHNVTLFMLLQSVYALVVSRWSNEADIVIGSPIAGRHHHEVEDLLGFFVNTLMFKHKIDGQSRFSDVLQQARSTTLNAFAHQDVPFEMLVEQLQPERSISHAPLCQLMFLMQNNRQVNWQLEGLTARPIAGQAQTIKHDLSLSVMETDHGLRLNWSYATDLFNRQSVERLAQSFTALLTDVLVAPHKPVNQLNILGQQAQQQLVEWNNTTQDYALDMTLNSMVARTAKRVPNAIALQQGALQLSYQQLDQITDRIACYLQHQGIGRGDHVGVYTPRHPFFIVGLLGALKAGAAYVPIEISSTAERIATIYDDAQLKCILTMDALSGNCPQAHNLLLLLDDCMHETWLATFTDYQSVSSESKDIAYVCYTSGSTGKPKGVEVSHRGVVDYCQNAMHSYYSEAANLSGAMVITSLAFDITVPALYLPLLNGHCVDFCPEQDALEEFAKMMVQRQSNALIRMTPMHGEALLSLLPDDFVCTASHCFVIGGEAFPISLARRLARVFPSAKIYNHYGPTETVVGCAMYDVSANLAKLNNALPIGKAMSNTELYVLDSNQAMTPAGVVGELYIGGEGVAKGYLNNPALTAEKFVELNIPGAKYNRFYRTGDLVKYDQQGNLWFVGRADNQIKLRGYRIELGEIEKHIARIPGVAKAVVVAHAEEMDKQLIAFIKPTDAELDEVLVARIREQLSATLPSYMIPEHFINLTEVPLSANGKINQKALLAQVQLAPREVIAPHTEVQQQLQTLWAKVLNKSPSILSIDANFFSSGGHSLLVIKLFSEVRKLFGNVLSVHQLYQYPTIAKQADYLTRAKQLYTNEQLVKLKEGAQGKIFIVHPIGGDVACYGQFVQHLALDFDIYAVQHPGYVGQIDDQFESLQALAQSYLAQIKQVQDTGPYYLLGWSFGGLVALTMAQQLESQAEQVSYVGLIDSVVKHNEARWQDFLHAYQSAGYSEHTPSQYLQYLQAQPALCDRFDKAYQVQWLAKQFSTDSECSVERVREVVLRNLASSQCELASQAVTQLHYYGATQTKATFPDNNAVFTALSEQNIRDYSVDGDHFSIMQTPQLTPLVAQIATDVAQINNKPVKKAQ